MMSELEHDLRATADDIAEDATRLTRIEQEKASLEADDPRLVTLSAASEKLARQIVPKTAAESELVDRLAEGGGSID